MEDFKIYTDSDGKEWFEWTDLVAARNKVGEQSVFAKFRAWEITKKKSDTMILKHSESTGGPFLKKIYYRLEVVVEDGDIFIQKETTES